MYIPREFQIQGQADLIEMLLRYPFSTLTSYSRGVLSASHVPLLYQDAPEPHLVGHLARANPHGETLDGAEVLVTFLGPDAYISPQWYGEDFSVPTWNYLAVHVRGTCEVVKNTEGTVPIIQDLLGRFESGASASWAAKLAHDPYQKMLAEIVGIRIRIESMEGKAKLGQNRSKSSREGAIAGLRNSGSAGSHLVADLMEKTLDRNEPHRE